MAESGQRERHSILAVNVGLGANAVLAVFKTFFGVFGHSPALLADGINSTSDVAYYIVVRVFMGMAATPADDEHPYGHRQLESVAALVVGAFVMTTAVAIFWDAVNKVYDLWAGQGDLQGASSAALVVALATVVAKIILTVMTRRIGRREENSAILALAYDHRNDIFAAAAASVGIVLGRAGALWVDPLAGAVVALLILHTGVEILRQSSGDLMDTVPGHALRQQVVRALAGVPGIGQVEEVLAHRFGPYFVINVTIGVDGTMSVAEGDRIATEVEQKLCRDVALVEKVHVHYHPKRKTTVEHA